MDTTNNRAENSCDIEFTMNGISMRKTVRSSLSLLSLIREELGMKGTKLGCFEGECGACSVLLDGAAVNSCLYLAVNIDGREITTIEGLTEGSETFDPIQKAMIDHGAVQCGFCTSGMVMSIKSYQKYCENRMVPDRESIKKALEGNLCRCTGYIKIIDAAESIF